MSVQLTYQSRDRFKTVTGMSQLSQLLTLTNNRLLGGKDIQITLITTIQITVVAEAETQKIQPGTDATQVDYSSLVAVQRQTQPPFERLPNPFLQTVPLIAGQNYKIIRITNQLGIGPKRRTVTTMPSWLLRQRCLNKRVRTCLLIVRKAQRGHP